MASDDTYAKMALLRVIKAIRSQDPGKRHELLLEAEGYANKIDARRGVVDTLADERGEPVPAEDIERMVGEGGRDA